MEKLTVTSILKSLENAKCSNCRCFLNRSEIYEIALVAIKYNEPDYLDKWYNLCSDCCSVKNRAAQYDTDYTY